MPQVVNITDLATNLNTRNGRIAARLAGRERIIVGVFTVTTAMIDGTDDIILLPPMPANSILHEFSTANDDMDTGAALTIDLGLTDRFGADLNPGGSDSRECILNASAWLIANNLTDHRFVTAGTTTRDDFLWELAGMTADPGGYLFPCVRIQAAAATPAAGRIIYRLRYCND